jgi:hypothetical protein
MTQKISSQCLQEKQTASLSNKHKNERGNNTANFSDIKKKMCCYKKMFM